MHKAIKIYDNRFSLLGGIINFIFHLYDIESQYTRYIPLQPMFLKRSQRFNNNTPTFVFHLYSFFETLLLDSSSTNPLFLAE